MRLLDRYLGRELLTSALFAVATLSVVLVLGQIFKKLFEFIVDNNVPATFILTFIAYFLPLSLVYSIPWGVLTAVLLVFGRLSAGNELTAMRMAGLGLGRIARPVLLVAALLSGVCLWINLYVAPRAQQNLKDAFIKVVTSNPSAAFNTDRPITDFPGYKISVGEREGDRIRNIHVFELNADNHPVRVAYARTGSLETDLAAREVLMHLQDVLFEQRDYEFADDLTKISAPITMREFPLSISLDALFEQKQGKRRVEFYTYGELKQNIADKRALLARDREELKTNPDPLLKRIIKADVGGIAAALTELNKRFSFSLACVTFALIGIPLGITAHRQETSAGFGLSLVVAVLYFLIIIVVSTVREKAGLHPELLVWLPNVIFLLRGGVLFYRLSRR